MISKIIFSVLVAGSSVSDLLMLEPVRASLVAVSMPALLGPFLGVAKMLGLIGIWQKRFIFLKSWAYAGLFFDHFGATYLHAIHGFPLPVDAILAPLYLIFTLYLAWQDSVFSKGESTRVGKNDFIEKI